MKSKILDIVGIDPGIILIIMLILLIAALVMAVCATMNYRRLKVTYTSFMRGKDGKTMEDSILNLMDDFEDLESVVKRNCQNIQKILAGREGGFQFGGRD